MSDRFNTVVSGNLLMVVVLIVGIFVLFHRQRQAIKTMSNVEELLIYHIGRSDYAIDLLELRNDSTKVLEP